MAGKVILHFDGASKGNPGKAGAGAVLKTEDGRVVSRISEGLGNATNNVAEYRGLIRGLQHAVQHEFKSIEVHGDSQLVCKQVNGDWQTRSPNMRELCNEVNQLKQNFDSFEMFHVPRGQNAEADHLANMGTTLASGAVYEVFEEHLKEEEIEKDDHEYLEELGDDYADPEEEQLEEDDHEYLEELGDDCADPMEEELEEEDHEYVEELGDDYTDPEEEQLKEDDHKYLEELNNDYADPEKEQLEEDNHEYLEELADEYADPEEEQLEEDNHEYLEELGDDYADPEQQLEDDHEYLEEVDDDYAGDELEYDYESDDWED